MSDLIFVQEGGSVIDRFRAPKTAAEVLNALRRIGELRDEGGVRLLGSDSLEAGYYAFKQADALSTTAPALTPVGGLLSKNRWFQQTLSYSITNFGSRPSSGRRERTHLEVNVLRWDFLPLVHGYVDVADDADLKHPPFTPLSTVFHNLSERMVEIEFFNVLRRVCSVLSDVDYDVLPQVSSRPDPETPVAIAKVLADPNPSNPNVYADFVVEYKNRRIAVIEMKRPSTFRSGDHEEPATLNQADRDRDTNPSLRNAMSQIYEYMCNMELGYGVISSLDVSYFLQRNIQNSREILQVSDPVPCQRPYFLGAVAYILDTAAHDNRVFCKPVEDAKVAVDKPPQNKAIAPDQGGARKPTNAAQRNQHGMKLRNRGSASYSGSRESLQETAAEHLHLASRPFASGWSGSIVLGSYEGLPIVVKLAPFGSERAEALLNEIVVYGMLRRCWETYVPKIVSYGTTAEGEVVYIATEFIDNHEIEVGTLTPDLEKAALDALDAVHDCGIVHGDIRKSNILFVNGGQQRVRLIDFGFSRPMASSEDCKRERAQLKELLKHLSGSQFNGNKGRGY